MLNILPQKLFNILNKLPQKLFNALNKFDQKLFILLNILTKKKTYSPYRQRHVTVRTDCGPTTGVKSERVLQWKTIFTTT